MWDVGVIGGGPAGSTAARLLAESGLSVILLEAATHPRVKPCGGALTDRGLALLPPGGERFFKNHPRQWTYRAANLPPVTVGRDVPYCHTVVRRDFDQFLFEEAAASGAIAHDGERVAQIESSPEGDGYVVKTAADRYPVRYLVGADGAKGMTARALGLSRPRNGAALEIEAEARPELLEAYRERCEVMVSDTPWGYCWVIPKGDRLNVGVGSFHASGFAWRERLQRYCDEIGFRATGSILAHPLPYRWARAALTRGRALLAGDAAGLMDPFSAEGIYAALSSGARAARVVTAAAATGTDLSAYDRELGEQVWPELQRAGVLARLFYTMPGAWSRLFIRDQSLLAAYLEVLEGRSGYDALLRATRERWWRIVRRAPPVSAS
jgi:geranylgeranyl reductase family protein